MKKEFIVHSSEEVRGIREATAAAAEVRDRLKIIAVPGMTTKEFDSIAGGIMSSKGGRSAFLGYKNFPGQICISLNDEVVHGIGKPNVIFRHGDLVSIDVGINLGGFIGDTALSFVIGGNPEHGETALLLDVTEKALYAGISAAKCGNCVYDISLIIEKTAKSAKLGVVREYVGHGCGTSLHEPPEVPNFVSGRKGPKLRPGMVLAIEPMFNLGTHLVTTDPDGWTVRTKDGRLSAHFEHMILVTENEPEVLTWRKM